MKVGGRPRRAALSPEQQEQALNEATDILGDLEACVKTGWRAAVPPEVEKKAAAREAAEAAAAAAAEAAEAAAAGEEDEDEAAFADAQIIDVEEPEAGGEISEW